MIHSMTGYGDAADEREGSRYLVEIKSLNNRYFKPTLRLPDAVSVLEPEIETILRQHLGRGSIVYTLRMKAADAHPAARINTAVLHAYARQLAEAGMATAEPDRLLHLPGVLEDVVDDDEAATLDRHRLVVLDLTRQAVEKLLQMRQVEGQVLLQDLSAQTTLISDLLETIKARAPLVVKLYHQRLTARVNELVASAQLSVSGPELVKEIAVFAERSDIAEELTRLEHHVRQFDAACTRRGEHVGRKLDFIAQEMLREANTIGSKANDAQVAGHIVDIKGSIDRIKEQVQNVE